MKGQRGWGGGAGEGVNKITWCIQIVGRRIILYIFKYLFFLFFPSPKVSHTYMYICIYKYIYIYIYIYIFLLFFCVD